ncbi:MAG: 5-formyltetrahydrofolate cyclo-ligase [Cognaticolwellia sp.]
MSKPLTRRNMLRNQLRQQRRTLSSQQQNDYSAQVLGHFVNDANIAKAHHIALYLSNDGELNTQLLIDWCWQQGKQVYLPVVHPFTSGHLLFLHYDQHTAMTTNRYGIAEPKLDVGKIIPSQQLDVICTPLVAFDKTGSRLGMGGGFYDRTLSHWYQCTQQQTAQQRNNQPTIKPYPIGLAHNCQLIDAIPTELWDIPLPEIITPAQHYKFY